MHGRQLTLGSALERITGIALRGGAQVRHCVAVAGGSCSGKTYLAKRLEQALGDCGVTSVRLPLDDYFRACDDPELPRDALGRTVFDVPAAFHLAELRSHAIQLLEGYSVLARRYDAVINRCLYGAEVKSGRVLVVEGLFAIDACEGIAGLRIFVDASKSTRLARRIARDRRFGVADDVIVHAFETRVEPYQLRHVRPQAARADLLVWSEITR
jgi:uridine kinase